MPIAPKLHLTSLESLRHTLGFKLSSKRAGKLADLLSNVSNPPSNKVLAALEKKSASLAKQPNRDVAKFLHSKINGSLSNYHASRAVATLKTSTESLNAEKDQLISQQRKALSKTHRLLQPMVDWLNYKDFGMGEPNSVTIKNRLDLFIRECQSRNITISCDTAPKIMGTPFGWNNTNIELTKALMLTKGMDKASPRVQKDLNSWFSDEWFRTTAYISDNLLSAVSHLNTVPGDNAESRAKNAMTAWQFAVLSALYRSLHAHEGGRANDSVSLQWTKEITEAYYTVQSSVSKIPVIERNLQGLDEVAVVADSVKDNAERFLTLSYSLPALSEQNRIGKSLLPSVESFAQDIQDVNVIQNRLALSPKPPSDASGMNGNHDKLTIADAPDVPLHSPSSTQEPALQKERVASRPPNITTKSPIGVKG